MQGYGIYQNIRNSSWRCLIDHDIRTLPIDVLKVARTAGFHVIKNSSVDILLKGENGRSYYTGNKWHIIYDDSNPTDISRFTIAHELGHIFLGHELKHINYSHIQQIAATPKSEIRADEFAIKFLCPACVLWKYELYSPEDISRACRVDMNVATKRANRMKTLVKRNCFLKSPIEQKFYENFFGKL